ncbi:MAG: class 1 fructose-bisphosphatase [Deltaproteobacteria bacterium]|nr:MAG: class 1 fructose-bisphosphatase [Deltaproteobacteria bacterium]
MSAIVSVQRHLLETQRHHPTATGDLTALLWDLTLAFKLINAEVNKAGLVNLYGLDGDRNASGDDVTKLDRFAQDTIFRMMDHGGHLCCMASEEEREIIPIPAKYAKGKYVLSYDPLDGSSNIDANVSVGTIFAIHRRRTPEGTDGTEEDVLQSGRALVAAGYVIYGSSTMLVLSTGQRVDGFTLDPSVGEFLLSHPDIRIPKRGKIYSVNEGNQSFWRENTRRYVDWIKSPEAGPYKGRYIGSMIADVHRTLLYGGIFLYPRTFRHDPVKGECKLRLLYEAGPMGWIVERAGGVATTGDEPVADLVPTHLHDTCPVAIGSPDDVADYLAFYRGER